MNRASKVSFFLFAGVVLLVSSVLAEDTATGTKLLSGLNRNNTGSALDGSWDATIVKATDVSSSDTTGQVVNQFGKAAEADAEGVKGDIAKLRKQIIKQPTGGLSPETMATRKQLLKDAEKAAADKSAGTWCSKIGKVLDVINVVAVAGKAAGYAAQGDLNGASGAIVSETTKRVTTAAGAFLGAPVPYAGPILGAAAGEEFHDAVTSKIIEKNVDIARVQDAKDKMLGTGAAPVQIMDATGGTRTLSSDMYVEPGTGNIKQRTPQQQKAYRDSISKDIHDREDAKAGPLDIALGKLMRGEISQADYDRQIEELNDPHRIPPVDEDETEKEPGVKQGGGDEGQAIEEADPVDPEAVKEAKDIAPVQVKATVAYDEDYSHQEYKNVVHSVVTLTFWNVGSLVPDHGGVTVSMTNTASINGSTDTVSGSGTFTGGPNGKFHLIVGGRNVRGKIVNGTTVTYAGHQGNVENPTAFVAWIK